MTTLTKGFDFSIVCSRGLPAGLWTQVETFWRFRRSRDFPWSMSCELFFSYDNFVRANFRYYTVISATEPVIFELVEIEISGIFESWNVQLVFLNISLVYPHCNCKCWKAKQMQLREFFFLFASFFFLLHFPILITPNRERFHSISVLISLFHWLKNSVECFAFFCDFHVLTANNK